MKQPPPRRCGIVAAVVALILLACLQIQYHHLKQVDLGKAGFVSATTQDNRWETKKIATGTRGLPRGILQPHSDMDLRPLYTNTAAATKNKNKNDDRNALLAMAVGISQIKNVDTMVRKTDGIVLNGVIRQFTFSHATRLNGGSQSVFCIQMSFLSMISSFCGMRTLEWTTLILESILI